MKTRTKRKAVLLCMTVGLGVLVLLFIARTTWRWSAYNEFRSLAQEFDTWISLEPEQIFAQVDPEMKLWRYRLRYERISIPFEGDHRLDSLGLVEYLANDDYAVVFVKPHRAEFCPAEWPKRLKAVARRHRIALDRQFLERSMEERPRTRFELALMSKRRFDICLLHTHCKLGVAWNAAGIRECVFEEGTAWFGLPADEDPFVLLRVFFCGGKYEQTIMFRQPSLRRVADGVVRWPHDMVESYVSAILASLDVDFEAIETALGAANESGGSGGESGDTSNTVRHAF